MTYQACQNLVQLIQGFDALILERIEEGWRAYFVNFMFKQVPGKTNRKKEIMCDEIMRVYCTLVTRVARRPKSPKAIPFLPILICCPDLPVYKHEKDLLRNVIVNDGLHYNGILLLPPKRLCRRGSDLRAAGLRRHFRTNQGSYYKDDRPLDRLHATRIRKSTMADYALKAIKSGKVAYDDILILPRTLSEL